MITHAERAKLNKLPEVTFNDEIVRLTKESFRNRERRPIYSEACSMAATILQQERERIVSADIPVENKSKVDLEEFMKFAWERAGKNCVNISVDRDSYWRGFCGDILKYIEEKK